MQNGMPLKVFTNRKLLKTAYADTILVKDIPVGTTDITFERGYDGDAVVSFYRVTEVENGNYEREMKRYKEWEDMDERELYNKLKLKYETS